MIVFIRLLPSVWAEKRDWFLRLSMGSLPGNPQKISRVVTIIRSIGGGYEVVNVSSSYQSCPNHPKIRIVLNGKYSIPYSGD